MAEIRRRLTHASNRMVDWFIPPAVAADKEASKQVRIFLISHLFGPFIGNTVPGALFLLDPTPGVPVAVLAISITAFWIFPFLVRAGFSHFWMSLLSVQNLVFCIFWSCYFYGGMKSPTLAWVLTIPLLAFFYLGDMRSARHAVFGIFTANLAVFLGFHYAGFEAMNDMPEASTEGLGIISTVAASLYVVMMSFHYSKILASQTELEGEMRCHLATAADLRAATLEAERASRAKSEFVAKMSHELRTPLNAVIGYSQVLIEDAAEEGDTHAIADLERIQSAGQQLLKIVNAILDLSKLEAGRMQLFEEEVAPAELVRGLAAAFAGLAAGKGNRIELGLDEDIGAIVCDVEKLRQAVQQILDNAVKYTENGVISCRARLDRSSGDLVIAVRDTGIGIAEEDRQKMFETFVGSGDYSSSKYGGTGIGLALSQRYCMLMGGRVEVESELGKGTCFTIRIPAKRKPASSPQTAEGAADEGGPCRIQVAA